MKPPQRQTVNYEKVKTDDFIPGIIEDIEYDNAHVFKYKGEEKTVPAVRLKFKLEGYKYSHRSRWIGFNYGEKSNLYTKFLIPLVDGAKPDMDFDLDKLKGMEVKTLWSEKNDFQTVETIRPINQKMTYQKEKSDMAETYEPGADDEVPF
jgi:hypothetical protein